MILNNLIKLCSFLLAHLELGLEYALWWG